MSKSKTTEGESTVRNGVLRMVLVIIAIVLELVFILAIFKSFNEQATWINIVTRIAAAIIVLGIYSQHRSASVKMP